MNIFKRILATLVTTAVMLSGASLIASPAEAAKPYKVRVIEKKSGKLKVKVVKKAAGVTIKKARIVKVNKARTKARVKVRYIKVRKVKVQMSTLRSAGKSAGSAIRYAIVRCEDVPKFVTSNYRVNCVMVNDPAKVVGWSYVNVRSTEAGVLEYQLVDAGAFDWVQADADGSAVLKGPIHFPVDVVNPPPAEIVELLPEVFTETKTVRIED